MISGISGSNSFHSYQATLNQYRLIQALNKNSGGQANSALAPSHNTANQTLSDSISYVKRYDATMTDFMNSANTLRDANSSGVMNEISVSSSDQDVLTASKRFHISSAESFDINVSQVAASQVNVSDSLSSAGPASDISMNITMQNGSSADIAVSALKADGTQKTNVEMLSDVAKEINSKSMGVDASVVTKDGKSSLKLTSTNTGAGNQFTVSGAYAEGNRIGAVSQTAQDAMYEVTKNGVTTSHSSATNDISLDYGKISVSLKKEGAATVSAGSDPNKIVSAMQDFVDNYNRADSLLSNNADRGSGTYRQLKNLDRVLGSEESQKMLGLSFAKDGSLKLDKTKLTESLKEKPEFTRDLIGGSFGLAQRGFSSASSALSTPVSSLINNDIANAEYESAVSSTNYMNAFSKNGSYNLMNYYSVGLLYNMIV